MKKYFDKRFKLVVSIMLIILFICIIIFFLVKNRLIFVLAGEENYQVEVGSIYKDPGAKAQKKGEDLSSLIKVDSSDVDSDTLGTYEVIYTLEYNNKVRTLKRKVEVVDTTKPVLSFNGKPEVVLAVGSEYEDAGCFASDNYDEEIKAKISVHDPVNPEVSGVYKVRYEVTDQSGNTSELIRKVVVKEDLEQDELEVMRPNNVTYMKYTDKGIYLEGYLLENDGTFIINICNSKDNYCFDYEMEKEDKYYYKGELNLTLLQNGEYSLYIEDGKEKEALYSDLLLEYKLARFKLKDKLITFDYDNNYLKIIVEDHEYKYDVVIDPGHGGEDPGALNTVTDENHFNLTQSLYEKERLEEHGLRVLLLRNSTDDYGIVMGNDAWPKVRQKGYAIGYYGTIAKLIYSNHHNSSEDITQSGWEIILPVHSIKKDVQVAYDVAALWEKSYPVIEEHNRLYTRNHATGAYFDKMEEDTYEFRNYYAVQRVPYELFNVSNIIFEGSYLSNEDDFNWYYTQENYLKMTEEKIKAIVEYFGVKYLAP